MAQHIPTFRNKGWSQPEFKDRNPIEEALTIADAVTKGMDIAENVNNKAVEWGLWGKEEPETSSSDYDLVDEFGKVVDNELMSNRFERPEMPPHFYSTWSRLDMPGTSEELSIEDRIRQLEQAGESVPDELYEELKEQSRV